MRRRKRGFFTVYTARGKGTYGSHAKAEAAARWVAQETGESVSVVDESTGQTWEVSAERVSIRRARPRAVVGPRIPSALGATA
jgi:hypothetical protein